MVDAAENVTELKNAVNKQVIDAVEFVNKVMAESRQTVGAGIAYQSASQSAALAVQDAEEHMRNVMTLGLAVMGAAYKQMVDDPASSDKIAPIIKQAEMSIEVAIAQFTLAGDAAGKLISEFPEGGQPTNAKPRNR